MGGAARKEYSILRFQPRQNRVQHTLYLTSNWILTREHTAITDTMKAKRYHTSNHMRPSASRDDRQH